MKKSLIFETLGSINEMKVEKSDKKGELMTLSGVFGVCGIVNNNNRVYEKSNYEAMVNQMKEIIKSEGGIPGELEHPTTMNITLENVSHKITDISIDEKGVVTGSITLLNTPKGQIAQAIVEGGLPLFVSSRATGEIQEGKVKLSKIFTYDLVGTPGFSQARVKLNENQHIDMLNENICVLSEEDDMENNIEEPVVDNDLNYNEGYNIKPQKPTVHAKETPVQPEDIPWKYKNIDGATVGGNGRVSKALTKLPFKEDENLGKKFIDYCSDKEIFKEVGGDVITNYKVEFAKDSVHITFLDDIFDEEVYYAGLKYLDSLPNGFPHNFYFSTSEDYKLVIVVRDNIENGCSYYCDGNLKIQFYSQDYYDNKNVSLEEIKALIKESEKRTEKFIMEQVAPGIEDWIINDYSPELEKYMVEHFAPEIEKWVTESFAGTLENWVNEELTPELIGKIKGEVNEQLKNTKESRLDSIKETIALLENISPNSPNFQPASSIINENASDEPIYIREMPKELRPKYNMASQAVKENLARRAKLYDFTVEGALERFWSSFDSIVESFQNQPTVNQPIILDSKEQSIREALRKRFKR